ncbi:hypothetical protein B0H13DRAFT_1879283 [Mycena leptocephala]|nr:hypothetical protein B0H13DRAFT_1879283 [Mycena leptocephala]
MIDVLASIHTPALRGMHLDALLPEFNYHFISKCGHLLQIPLRLSLKFADAFQLEDITGLINAFTSITRLDIRRQGLRGEVVVTDMLMSGDLLLDDLEYFRIEWPISEAAPSDHLRQQKLLWSLYHLKSINISELVRPSYGLEEWVNS